MGSGSAFKFFGKAQQNLHVILKRKALTNSNIIFLAVDTALEVVKAGISFADYVYEKDRTEKLHRELERAKDSLDEGYKEKVKQNQIILEEKRKRMKQEWMAFKFEIEKAEDQLKVEVERLSTLSENQHREHMKRLTLNDALRAPILDMLTYTGSLIDKEMEKGTRHKSLYKLQEDYRLAHENYNKLIQGIL